MWSQALNTDETGKEALSTRPSMGRTPGTRGATVAHGELGRAALGGDVRTGG